MESVSENRPELKRRFKIVITYNHSTYFIKRVMIFNENLKQNIFKLLEESNIKEPEYLIVPEFWEFKFSCTTQQAEKIGSRIWKYINELEDWKYYDVDIKEIYPTERDINTDNILRNL